MSDLAAKWVRLALNRTNRLTEPNVQKSDLYKSPGFFPFKTNLTLFGAKSDIPGFCNNQAETSMQIYAIRMMTLWFFRNR